MYNISNSDTNVIKKLYIINYKLYIIDSASQNSAVVHYDMCLSPVNLLVKVRITCAILTKFGIRNENCKY